MHRQDAGDVPLDNNVAESSAIIYSIAKWQKRTTKNPIITLHIFWKRFQSIWMTMIQTFAKTDFHGQISCRQIAEDAVLCVNITKYAEVMEHYNRRCLLERNKGTKIRCVREDYWTVKVVLYNQKETNNRINEWRSKV